MISLFSSLAEDLCIFNFFSGVNLETRKVGLSPAVVVAHALVPAL